MAGVLQLDKSLYTKINSTTQAAVNLVNAEAMRIIPDAIQSSWGCKTTLRTKQRHLEEFKADPFLFCYSNGEIISFHQVVLSNGDVLKVEFASVDPRKKVSFLFGNQSDCDKFLQATDFTVNVIHNKRILVFTNYKNRVVAVGPMAMSAVFEAT